MSGNCTVHSKSLQAFLCSYTVWSVLQRLVCTCCFCIQFLQFMNVLTVDSSRDWFNHSSHSLTIIHLDLQSDGCSSGSRNFGEGGPRNMKYKPPHMVAIFIFGLFFYRPGGGGSWPPWPPPWDGMLTRVGCLSQSTKPACDDWHESDAPQPSKSVSNFFGMTFFISEILNFRSKNVGLNEGKLYWILKF